MPYGRRLGLIAIFVVVAVLRWPTQSSALTYGPLDIMPAISTSGGPLTEGGLHFDDANAEFGAYDYSAPATTPVWVRGMAVGNQSV